MVGSAQLSADISECGMLEKGAPDARELDPPGGEIHSPRESLHRVETTPVGPDVLQGTL